MSRRPVVLLVGGSSGIGATVARLLSQAPADERPRLALASRDRTALVRAARELPEEPQLVTCDVTDAASVDAAVAAVVETHGRLDAVVTSAAVVAYGTVEQVPPDVFEHCVETSVHGTANLARAVLPVFRAQGSGTLVVVSSLLGQIPVPSMTSYVTGKWGQLGLVRSLQLELRAERDIHVCLVSPGAVDTPVYAQAGSYAGSAGSAPPPVVAPERVARAIVSCLHRPRRFVRVGPGYVAAVLGSRLAPGVYDRLAGPLVDRVLLRGPAQADHSGNVLTARPEGEARRGGWTPLGRLRDRAGRARWRRDRATRPLATASPAGRPRGQEA